MNHRLTSRALPYSEPSATIVWEALCKFGIEERTILWNAIQMHPHKEGKPQSNRKPTSDEIEKGQPALRMLVDAFRSAKVVAVGRTAERSLKSMGVHADYAPHPAYGGKKEFTKELERLVSG